MTPPDAKPVSSDENPYEGLPEAGGLSRRGIFVDIVTAAIGLAMTIPLVGYLFEPLTRKRAEGIWIRIGKATDLRGERRVEVDYSFTRVDTWLPSTTKRRVIVGSESGDAEAFAVYSSACTHLGCGVRWEEEKKQFLCPCHGGVFDSEGRPISGPIYRPLTRLQARISKDGHLEVLEG